MEQNEQTVMEWFLWHRAVEFIKQDIFQVESAELSFPLFAGWVLRQTGRQVYAKERAAANELRANGIRFVKEKLDLGEIFVVWAHRGNTDIIRISEEKLRAEVQKKVDELFQDFIPEKK